MAYGNLTYSVNLPQERLNHLINGALALAIDNDEMEVNGVEVKLSKAGDAIANMEGKSITLDLPLHIELKRSAGLFTVEGKGGISLKIKVNYDISSNIQLKAKSEIVSHEWISKPKLEFGALNIPVETLMNLVLNHYESILTAKIDQAINEKSNLMGYLNQGIMAMENQINKTIPFDRFLDVKFDKLSNLSPRTDAGYVLMDGAVDFALSLQEAGKIKDDQLPKVDWISKLPESKPAGVTISLGYSDIARQMVERLSGISMGGRNFEVTDVDISYEEELLLTLSLDEPIKGKVEITGNPVFDKETGVLNVEDIDVNVKPANIIYKLTAPLVNKFAETKIEDFLPVQLKEIIKDNLSKLPKSIEISDGTIRPKVEDVTVHDITFTDKDLEVYLTLEGLHIDFEFA